MSHISVNEYKPERRAAKIAALVAQGVNQKQSEKRYPKRFETIIRLTLPGGRKMIERKLTPASCKSGARDWAESHERKLLAQAYAPTPEAERPKAPTLAQWWPRYMETCVSEGGAEGDGLTPATIANKQSAYDAWLRQHLGALPLDEITNAKRSALQAALKKAGRTQTNILQALSSCLSKAVENGIIDRMPCKFGKNAKLKNQAANDEAPFYLHPQYAALLAAAPDLATRVMILLGGDAGLRAGEIAGLEWSAVSFDRMEITVRKAIWFGVPPAEHQAWIAAGRRADARPAAQYIEKSPKHGKVRRVDMTPQLASALRKLRLQTPGARVLTQSCGQWLHRGIIAARLSAVEQAAKLGRQREGCVHVLRHTFCSHLALAGVAPHVIMRLAGHHALTVTQRYMHLAPDSAANAVAQLAAFRAAETSAETKRAAAATV